MFLSLSGQVRTKHVVRGENSIYICLSLCRLTFIPENYLALGEIMFEWDQNDGLIIFNHFNILKRILARASKACFLRADFD